MLVLDILALGGDSLRICNAEILDHTGKEGEVVRNDRLAILCDLEGHGGDEFCSSFLADNLDIESKDTVLIALESRDNREVLALRATGDDVRLVLLVDELIGESVIKLEVGDVHVELDTLCGADLCRFCTLLASPDLILGILSGNKERIIEEGNCLEALDTVDVALRDEHKSGLTGRSEVDLVAVFTNSDGEDVGLGIISKGGSVLRQIALLGVGYFPLAILVLVEIPATGLLVRGVIATRSAVVTLGTVGNLVLVTIGEGELPSTGLS